MAVEKPTLPNCGLYRTGIALVGQEQNVPEGILVMFHNHSDQGPPIVLKPESNQNNRWTFHERGWSVNDSDFLRSLVSLQPEGLYEIKGELLVDRNQRIKPKTLVQLGYNRSGDSILFVGEFVQNTIHFPNKGFRFPNPKVQEHLSAVSFRVPTRRTIH
jgi:hypothetical protein